MTHAYLAVDAGNSKTVAVVVDSAGHVLGRGRGGRGDIYGAPTVEDALDAVFGAIDGALLGAGIRAQELADGRVTSAAFHLAGVDFPEDAAFWHNHLLAKWAGIGQWSIKNDGFASLRLIDGTGVGVAITVGTGPAVAARAADGTEECTGMFVFEDLGGGGLGNSARRAVCMEWMGLGPPTALTPTLCEFYGVADGWQLHHAFTQRWGARPESDLWKASRLVLRVAGEGDAVAQRIVHDQARTLVGYAQWCAQRVGVDLTSGQLPVLLNGSVATSQYPTMRDALTTELTRVAPRAPVHIASAAPLCGAVLDALALGGIEITPVLLASVCGDHPQDFLMT